jgi:hypothetical protein
MVTQRLRRSRSIASVALLCVLIGATPARAAASVAHAARANSTGPLRTQGRGTPRAPSGPPLSSPVAGTAGDESSAAGAGELDPLVSNGLGSPSCRPSLRGGLSPSAQRHCETSGLVASAAPTGDYGIDVHIDTGAFGLSRGGLLSVVQSLLLTPAWMALVWAVHALVVMLEWCFTVDLLGSAATEGFGGALRSMERSLTEPWLPLALSVAAVLALYHGLIRRRVAETVGQVALMVAMMAGGLWVILDPAGTVGALGQWADQAAVGTLATASRGSPVQPGQALAANLEGVFAAAVEAPWCYLEFGDVGWCRRPERLNQALYRTGLRIAAEEQSLVGCRLGPLVPCATAGSGVAKVLQRSAQMLRDARSNGAIFLALPANGPARNSINDEGSLLRTLCGSANATSCSAPTAAQAQFRTDNSTWSRVGGLLLIAAGLLGMLLLLGFLALRLLAAAIFSLLYLLLAPAMVLAPAFGDGGRELFRRWVSLLLGTLTAKLLYSFLLGVVMAVLAAIASLSTIGWWTQWLLMSALWWGAFLRRHHALGFASRGSEAGQAHNGALTRRFAGALEAPRALVARQRAKRNGRPGPAVTPRPDANARGSPSTTPFGGPSPRQRSRGGPASAGSSHAKQSPAREDLIAEKHAQLDRIHSASEAARANGQDRRATELAIRGERVTAELEALRSSSAHGPSMQPSSGSRPPEQSASHEHVRQAPHRTAAGGERTDPAALAHLAGSRREDQRLDATRRAAARPQIDRAIALREELSEARPRASTSPAESPPSSSGAQQRAKPSVGARERTRAPESIIMREAREVESGRKRQLGRDRP